MKGNKAKILIAFLSIALLVFFVFSAVKAVPRIPSEGNEGIAYDPELIKFNRGWTVSRGSETYMPESLPFHVPGSRDVPVTMVNSLPAYVTRGTYLAFRISTCFVDVYIGDELIYTGPVTENMARKTPVPGWFCVPLDEDYSARVIKICINDPYLFYGVTIPQIVVGSHAEVLLYASGTSYMDYYIAVAVIVFGLLVVFFAFMRSGNAGETLRDSSLGAFIAVAGIYLLCRAGMTRMDVYQSYAEYIVSEFSLRLCPLIFSVYILLRSSGEKKKLPKIMCIISAALLCAGLILQTAGLADLRATESVVFLLIWVELSLFLIRKRSESGSGSSRFKTLPSIGLLCALGSSVLLSFPSLGVYTALVHSAYALMFIFALTAAADLALSVSLDAERSALLAKELSESRMKIMMSQMQPHFIYNTLSTIRTMIVKPPEEARSLLIDFTRYLRFNLNALGNVAIVPIEEELAHTKVYTDIEQARFKESLKVVYDIGEESFSVPPLSIQPFVENAVKHGIRKDKDGGTVTVRTFTGDDSYIVEIEDDGIGFDTSILEKPSQRGVGIMNAVTRLRSQMGASVDIDSVKGRGTRVSISIPKDRGRQL